MADGVNRACMTLVQWGGSMKICNVQNSRNLTLGRNEVGIDFKRADCTLTICCTVNRETQFFTLKMTLRNTSPAR